MTAPQIYEIDGNQYKVEGFSKAIQDSFIEYMRFHELDAIKRARQEIGDEDYYVMLRRHLAHASYNHKFGSDHFFMVIANPDTLCELLWYAFTVHQECNRQVIADWIRRDTKEAVAVFHGLFDAREQ